MIDTPSRRRLILIDAWRGFAIVQMVIYHFFYDLSYFDLVDIDFYRDPFWINARTFILSQFLGLVGISLVLASYPELNVRRYLKRLLLLLVQSVAGYGFDSTAFVVSVRLV